MFTINEIIDALKPIETNISHASNKIKAISTDSRKIIDNSIFLALEGENFDGHDFLNAAKNSGAIALCVNIKYLHNNKNFNLPFIAVKNTLNAYQTLANYHRTRSNCKIIAITGSSGKTSTKEILYSVLKENFGENSVLCTEGNTNNHIGVPYNLLRIKPYHKFAVIEMGTNHPGEIASLANIANPDIAIITSIGNAHLEFFKNLDNTASEKSDVLMQTSDFYSLKRTPIAIIPAQSPGNKIIRKKAGANLITFSSKKNNADVLCEYIDGNILGSTIKISTQNNLLKTTTINWKLHGEHQASNAAAATAAAIVCKCSIENLKIGLEKTTLPGFRMKIFESNNITWINDAYNANPESMSATLDWFYKIIEKSHKTQDAIIILGDMLETGTKSQSLHVKLLKLAIKLFPESTIITVGHETANAVKKINLYKNLFKSFENSTDASIFLKQILHPGNIVFLKASRSIKLENCYKLNHSDS